MISTYFYIQFCVKYTSLRSLYARRGSKCEPPCSHFHGLVNIDSYSLPQSTSVCTQTYVSWVGDLHVTPKQRPLSGQSHPPHNQWALPLVWLMRANPWLRLGHHLRRRVQNKVGESKESSSVTSVHISPIE